jgi:pyruvate,water dikinase
MTSSNPHVLDFSQVGAGDVALVGGKCSSLGELFRELTTQGVRAVDGFSTTSDAYHLLLDTGGLRARLKKLLKGLDVDNLDELARVGNEARSMMLETPFPKDVEAAIIESYKRLGQRIGKRDLRGRGPLVCYGRGPSGRVVRRTAGHDPERTR